jgi:hypothetical protein
VPIHDTPIWRWVAETRIRAQPRPQGGTGSS